MTRGLRPAGGDSSVLGNMLGDCKDLEAGMLLHVLKELEGGKARAACAGHPSLLFSSASSKNNPRPRNGFGGNAPRPALLEETEAQGGKAASSRRVSLIHTASRWPPPQMLFQP